jgi:hypothetical protein
MWKRENIWYALECVSKSRQGMTNSAALNVSWAMDTGSFPSWSSTCTTLQNRNLIISIPKRVYLRYNKYKRNYVILKWKRYNNSHWTFAIKILCWSIWQNLRSSSISDAVYQKDAITSYKTLCPLVHYSACHICDNLLTNFWKKNTVTCIRGNVTNNCGY